MPHIRLGFTPSLFRPTMLSGFVSWLNPTLIGNVEKDGADRVNALQDTSVTRDELLLNPGFESGDPPDDWEAVSGAVLTRLAVDPVEGSYYMRETKADTSACIARQSSVMTAGAAYRITGSLRGDGVAGGGYRYGATAIISTASATWDALDAVFVTNHAEFRIQKTAGGVWIEADNTSLIRCADAIQATAADQPLWVADAGDGTAALRWDAANTEYLWTAIVPNVGSGTICGWFRKSATAVSQLPIGSVDGGANRCLIAALDGSNWVGGIGATWPLNSGVAVTTNWTFVALTWDGTDEVIDVDGTRVSQSVGEIPSTTAIYLGCYNNNGADDLHWDGDIGQCFVYDRALTANEIAILRRNTART